jgi:Uncharacterized protein conserved in archaea
MITVLCGVALIEPTLSAGLQSRGDPASLDSLWTFAAALIAGLATFLLFQRYDQGRRLLQIGFGGYLAWLFGKFITVWTNLALPSAIVIGAVVPIVLFLYPEWYTVNIVGVLWGGSMVAVLGVSFAPKIAVIVLIAWAMYDAYAVYYSDGMETIVTAGIDMSLPTAFYIPKSFDATLQDGDPLSDGQFRLLGVGDALVPGILVVSATEFIAADSVLWVLNGPAVGGLIGAIAGLIMLEVLINWIDNMHAGLPILNTATLCGYLAGAMAAGVGVTGALGI